MHRLNFFIGLHFLLLTTLLLYPFLNFAILNLVSKLPLCFKYIQIILLIFLILLHYLDQTFALCACVVLFNYPHKRYTSIRRIFGSIQVIYPFVIVSLQGFMI